MTSLSYFFRACKKPINANQKPLENPNGMIDFLALLWQTIDKWVFPSLRCEGKNCGVTNFVFSTGGNSR
jgi:hypothetical protein